jgi:hypothetical protein
MTTPKHPPATELLATFLQIKKEKIPFIDMLLLECRILDLNPKLLLIQFTKQNND